MKEDLVKLGAGLGLSFVLSFILYFITAWWESYLFLCAFNIVLLLYLRKFTFKRWLVNCAIILAFIWVIRFLNKLGFWGWIVGIVLLVAYMLYSRWDVYMEQKHKIETQIFGKPIYKFKEDGEQVPKVKIKF